MSFFGDGLAQAWRLILDGDPYLVELIRTTLLLAGASTAAALVLGLPPGLALGLGRFRGAGALRVMANAGLMLPPVVVGLVFTLLLVPVGPWGGLELLFTFEGVIVAQTALSLPIVVALTSSAVRDLPVGLLDQARAFGASRLRIASLATREARVGVLAAIITSIGSAFSEVGVVVLVGGNIQGKSQTLASAALVQIDAGRFATAFAIGLILLGVVVVVTALLTWLQYGGRRQRAGAWRAVAAS